MSAQKLLIRFASLLTLFSGLVFSGGVASAASTNATVSANAAISLAHVQFSATGFATNYVPHFTNPPQVGNFFILQEDLKDASGNTIGTDSALCTVVGFTSTGAITFKCAATFNFADGSVQAVAKFDFNPASLPVQYDAKVVSGTGRYALASGTIHVVDFGPGNPTGYTFDLTTL